MGDAESAYLRFQRYPRNLRDAYDSVDDAEAASESRHSRLLFDLGEASLAYLASLAFADYRRGSWDAPDPTVEALIAGKRHLTLGEYQTLFEKAHHVSARRSASVFVLDLAKARLDLPQAAHFIAAKREIAQACQVGPIDNLRYVIDRSQRTQTSAVKWSQFWQEFVHYRNYFGHRKDHDRWPRRHPDYWELMTPIVEQALLEVLTAKPAQDVLVEYPVAALERVTVAGGQYVHHLVGRYMGSALRVEIPLADHVERQWPLNGEAQAKPEFVLSHGQDGEWAVYAPFVNFETTVPPPLAGAESTSRKGGPAPTDEAKKRDPQLPEPRKAAPDRTNSRVKHALRWAGARRRKVLVAAGAGVLILGIILGGSTLLGGKPPATVRLDSDLAITRATRDSSGFRSAVQIDRGDTVQVSAVVNNFENAESGLSAEDFRIHYTVPKGPDRAFVIRGSVTADNLRIDPRFKVDDAVTITSESEAPLTLGPPQSFQYLRNDTAQSRCDRATFRYGEAQALPAERVDMNEEGGAYEVSIDPNGNGRLEPGYCRVVSARFSLTAE